MKEIKVHSTSRWKDGKRGEETEIVYHGYTVIREWTDEELEKELSKIEFKDFIKYGKNCPECKGELAIIMLYGGIGTSTFLHCVECHKYYDITDISCW